MEINATTILILLAGGFIGMILSSIFYLAKTSSLKKEIKEDKDYINKHIKMSGEERTKLENENKKLKEINDNLSLSVKTLNQKPGNAEKKVLHIYDNAIRKMIIQAPGFSTTWEVVLQEAEIEYENSEKGLKAIVNKVLKRNGSSNINEYSDTTTKLLNINNK